MTVAAVLHPALGRDADAMLLALMHGPRSVPVRVFSSQGQQWYIDREASLFHGSALHGAGEEAVPGELRFALCAESAAPEGGQRKQPLDQWVYWLARGTRGEQLIAHREEQRVTVTRGVGSALHGRAFVRLMVAFHHPMNVAEAAGRTGLPPATVRRFLNGSAVLGRVQTHGHRDGSAFRAESRTDVPGLFSRLLQRLRGRS